LAQRASLAVASILAIGAATFAWLRTTNFRGYDEWLVFSLLSRGILDAPHANRPLSYVCHVPAWLLAPDQLWGFLVVHATWLTLSGVLTFLLVRRLLPRTAALAFLAGVFTVVWMPSDEYRVATIQGCVYSGCTVGVLLATWLLVEAWCRRRLLVLPLAVLSAVAAILSHEAVLPGLAVSPFLLLVVGGARESRRWLRWTIATFASLLAAVTWIAVRLLVRREALDYQLQILGVAPSPWHVVHRVGLQLRYHLLPLVTTPSDELQVWAVPVVMTVFLPGLVLVTRGVPEPRHRGVLALGPVALAGLVGLVHAALAYAPFASAKQLQGASRTEFLSAPGIGLLLASSVVLIAGLTPRRLRATAVALLSAWVVAVGTARTLTLQREWDPRFYMAQRQNLSEITMLAPRLQPHTLVVLVPSRGWPFNFTFAKAISYLYDEGARGFAPYSSRLLWDTRLAADGIVSEPAPVLRRGWHDPVERYRYEEVIVFGKNQDGRLGILDSWPKVLGPLPAGATYEPRLRLRSGVRGSPRLAILDAGR
jgi:hypothetical protein